jgi:hypothetical protein
MTIFQIFGIALTGTFAAFTLIGAWRRQMGRLSGTFWSLIWLAGAFAIAYPESTVWVARALGIARGADLVFYLAILGMMIGFFLVYVRLRRMERNISLLVRRIALDEAPESVAGDAPRPQPDRG